MVNIKSYFWYVNIFEVKSGADCRHYKEKSSKTSKVQKAIARYQLYQWQWQYIDNGHKTSG